MDEATEALELQRVLLHLQSAHRLAGIGSWEADLRAEGLPRLYWSPEVHEIAGRPADQPPTYQDFVAMVHPDDRPLFLEARSAALTGERPYDMDLRVVVADGTLRRVRIVGEVVRDDEGNPVRLVGAVKDQTEEIEALRRLRMTEVARRDLLQRLLATADIERDRLVRHLADGSIDRLVEIEQRIAADMPEDASTRWTEALAAVRKAIDSLDRTLTNIQAEPSTSDLPCLVEEVANETLPGVEVTTDVALGVSLPSPVQAALLRVTHEALHNVRKHAEATRADVRWRVADGSVHVVVTDDGRGFDVDTVQREAGHLGIVAMRERLADLGGHLDIRSGPGGTTVAATIPVA